MKDFVRRLALPLVFAVIGVGTILLNLTTLKRREFEYISREGPRQMFSAAQTPTVYWIVTIGIFVVGTLFLAAAIFLFFRRPTAPPSETVASASSTPFRTKLFWFIVNLAIIPLGIWTGYGGMAPETLRGTNPDQFLCLALLILMPVFAIGTMWMACSRSPSFRRPSWYRNPLKWATDPLQALFMCTLGSFGLAIGSQLRIAGSGEVGFWTVAMYWCLFVGLLIGQALGYLMFRERIIEA